MQQYSASHTQVSDLLEAVVHDSIVRLTAVTVARESLFERNRVHPTVGRSIISKANIHEDVLYEIKPVYERGALSIPVRFTPIRPFMLPTQSRARATFKKKIPAATRFTLDTHFSGSKEYVELFFDQLRDEYTAIGRVHATQHARSVEVYFDTHRYAVSMRGTKQFTKQLEKEYLARPSAAHTYITRALRAMRNLFT